MPGCESQTGIGWMASMLLIPTDGRANAAGRRRIQHSPVRTGQTIADVAPALVDPMPEQSGNSRHFTLVSRIGIASSLIHLLKVGNPHIPISAICCLAFPLFPGLYSKQGF
jgi:hypothetical protein